MQVQIADAALAVWLKAERRMLELGHAWAGYDTARAVAADMRSLYTELTSGDIVSDEVLVKHLDRMADARRRLESITEA